MKTLANILLSLATLALLVLVCVEPFGCYTPVTYAINYGVIFFGLPMIAILFASNNPELIKK